MAHVVLVGRIFFSLLFLFALPGHFTANEIAYAATKGLPFATVLVPVSGIIMFVGALSILLGYKARYGAWLLVLFLVPVTLVMHRFWGLPDPATAQSQQIHFMKNLSILGAALLIAYFGSGPLSLDRGK